MTRRARSNGRQSENSRNREIILGPLNDARPGRTPRHGMKTGRGSPTRHRPTHVSRGKPRSQGAERRRRPQPLEFTRQFMATKPPSCGFHPTLRRLKRARDAETVRRHVVVDVLVGAGFHQIAFVPDTDSPLLPTVRLKARHAGRCKAFAPADNCADARSCANTAPPECWAVRNASLRATTRVRAARPVQRASSASAGDGCPFPYLPGLLMRMPIRKTTKSPSTRAVMRCGITLLIAAVLLA